MTDLSQAIWRKATRSTGANTGCVEVAANLPDVTAVRDSKNPDAGALLLAKSDFATFLRDVKSGRYDI